jgi:hypothetical protein
MKLLNLDELVSQPRVVGLKGTDYEIAEQSVGTMIESMQIAEMEEADTEQDATKILVKLLRVAKTLIPTCPEEVVHSMTIKQLMALVEFASASDLEVDEGAEVEVTEGEEAGKKQA